MPSLNLEHELKQSFLFDWIAENVLEELIDFMDLEYYPKGSYIVEQGDICDTLYIIFSGGINILKDGNMLSKNSDEKVHRFGELNLCYDIPSPISVLAATDVELFTLDRTTFRFFVSKSQAHKLAQVYFLLVGIEFLGGLSGLQISKIATCMAETKFHPKEFIYKKGEAGKLFYIVKSGLVKITGSQRDPEDRVVKARSCEGNYFIGPGDFFGEHCIVEEIFLPRLDSAQVWSDEPVELFYVDSDTMRFILGGSLQAAMDYNRNMNILEENKLFGLLTSLEKSRVGEQFKEFTFKKGDKIVSEGDIGSQFIAIKEGKACVSKKVDNIDKYEGDLIADSCFGEFSLLKDEIRLATVTAVTDVDCFILERKDFDKILVDVKVRLEAEKEQTARLNEIHSSASKKAKSILVDVKFLNTFPSIISCLLIFYFLFSYHKLLQFKI